MASPKRIPLTRAELALRRQAYLVALGHTLLKGKGRINPAGVSHIASEHADRAVLDDRRVRSEGL